MNTKKFQIAIIILIVFIAGFFNTTHAQEKNGQSSQNWYIPDLENSPVEVSIESNYSEVLDSIPIRGTKYMIRVPENWNGTLISDLDYVKSANSKRNLYLLEHGFALSGTQRRSGRLYNYDPAHEIHDVISVLDIFESIYGKPKNVIQLGCSGGGTITLAMAEIHPDRIDGAIAGCASTSPWMANTHLDGLFVLQALIAPELPIVGLPLKGKVIEDVEKKWRTAIDNAQKTPEGRARIALAVTIGQWPAWGAAWMKAPPSPDVNNAKTLQECMYQCIRMLLPSRKAFGTGMLEQSAPGQLRFNTNVDYKISFENGNPQYKKAVEKLYKNTQLNLSDELDKINSFKRIEADANALKWWSAPGRTHLGEPKVPLLRINTSGDGLVYPSMAQGYGELVKERGYSDFFRIAYVDSWGHCSFSLAEWLAAIETMKQRIETGVWPATDSETLNTLGKSLDSESKARYFEYKPVTKYNRTWVPTAEDFRGTKKLKK
ncbi:alpha/beta hydrolase [Lutibacter citreus]|uniref:alpha/beta hydrolase n=1 Tax=Lutibacter citreus TaxID=2138210 RepID=UPI000DBE239D|nr:alpha/beta hydrolase [Lutibacter citreus]